MSGFINSFLRTEITIIPQVIKKYIGNYDNALTNGATWMFFIWTIIHCIFDKAVDSLLLKMQYKEYLRIRLIDAVWNLGFYSCSFWYCTATLYKNNIDMFDQKRTINTEYDNSSSNLVLGFVFLIAYLLHSSMRDATKHGICVLPFSNFFLAVFLFTTYITRKLELAFALFAVVSFSHSGIELIRCLVCLLKDNTKMTHFLSKIMLIISMFLLLLSHGFTIPIVLVIPLGHELILNHKSHDLWALNITIWLWLSFEIFNNVVYKLIRHVVLHKKVENPSGCLDSTVECTLFFPRDDLAYHMKIVRKEIEERRQGQLGLRKPRNRNMLIQMLKSVAMLSMIAENSSDKDSFKEKTTVEMIRDGMVAIRKKLYQKRLTESSDSESDSENLTGAVSSDDTEKENQERDQDDSDFDEKSDDADELTSEVAENHENSQKAMDFIKDIANDRNR